MSKKSSRFKNLGFAGVAALTGFVPLIVIIGALFIGLWLDSRIGRRGPATIVMLLLSTPVSLYVMTRIALSLVKHIQPEQEDALLQNEEEVIS